MVHSLEGRAMPSRKVWAVDGEVIPYVVGCSGIRPSASRCWWEVGGCLLSDPGHHGNAPSWARQDAVRRVKQGS